MALENGLLFLLERVGVLMEPSPPSARLLTLVTLPLMLHPASSQSKVSSDSHIIIVVITWFQCGLGRGLDDLGEVLFSLDTGGDITGLAGVVGVRSPDDAHDSPVVVTGAPHQQGPGARVSPGDAGQPALLVNLKYPV